MVRPDASTLAPRSATQLADAEDLHAVISAALAATPIDDAALRRGVWTLVGMERDAGASPGYVIIGLTDLVDMAPLAPTSVKQARLRQVILWCVEAYFGHLGGDALGGCFQFGHKRSTKRVESMSAEHRPFVRAPLATPAEVLNEPAAFPVTRAAAPLETCFSDWRRRLSRNLSRRSDGRWEPLTYVYGGST